MTDMDVREAEQVTARIRQWVRDFPIEDVRYAYEGRVWIALGYDSWDEWCDCELDGFILPAPERKKVVADLAATGMSNRSIAKVVGAGRRTVDRDVAESGGSNGPPEQNAQKSRGADGKGYPKRKPARKPAPKPDPEVDIEDVAIEIDGVVIQPDELIEKARAAQEALKAERKADSGGCYIEITKEVAYILPKLRSIMEIADGVDFDSEERDLIAEKITKMESIIGLIKLIINGELDVDWDAEFQKIL